MSIATRVSAPIAPWPDNVYRYELVERVLVRVEVTGAAQRQNEMDAQARRYLSIWTALAGVVWPEKRAIDVWCTGDSGPSTSSTGCTVDGERVVPGFTFHVAQFVA